MIEGVKNEIRDDIPVRTPVKDWVVGIKLSNSGKVHPFLTSEEGLRVGQMVIVEADSGENFGTVAMCKHTAWTKKSGRSAMKKVLRKASAKDMERVEENSRLEKNGRDICQQKIDERGLRMKLCRVHFRFDGQKATFFFTAEGRVDFRNLVRDLAHYFKIKIEMRQIGVRDEARMIGGCGPCGAELCCASFLRDFEPVSIKMAKDQDLPLNPVKISGVCGRLMCCLVYEHQTYKRLKSEMPRCGTCVKTKTGTGVIKKVHLLQKKVTVHYPEGGKIESLPVSEITIESKPASKGRKKDRKKNNS